MKRRKIADVIRGVGNWTCKERREMFDLLKKKKRLFFVLNIFHVRRLMPF